MKKAVVKEFQCFLFFRQSDSKSCTCDATFPDVAAVSSYNLGGENGKAMYLTDDMEVELAHGGYGVEADTKARLACAVLLLPCDPGFCHVLYLVTRYQAQLYGRFELGHWTGCHGV